jgi:hypothetical protein
MHDRAHAARCKLGTDRHHEGTTAHEVFVESSRSRVLWLHEQPPRELQTTSRARSLAESSRAAAIAIGLASGEQVCFFGPHRIASSARPLPGQQKEPVGCRQGIQISRSATESEGCDELRAAHGQRALDASPPCR